MHGRRHHSRQSRPTTFALLCSMALFSACVPILGFETPELGAADPCQPFSCIDGVCKIRAAAFNTPCGDEKVCNGVGKCLESSGSKCTDDAECASNNCFSNTCKVDLLESCRGPSDCLSNQCFDQQCRQVPGGPCSVDSECAPASCINETCGFPDNSDCDFSYECASNVCRQQKCLGSDGTSCVDNANCASGLCSMTDKTCSLSPGKYCTLHEQCASNFCLGYRCITQSCTGLPNDCGSDGTEQCCNSLLVEQGTFDRENNDQAPANIAHFYLDRFEVTVERFRKFVNAYPENQPYEGAGKHPYLANSGWNPAWNPELPKTRDDLIKVLGCNEYATWSAVPGINDKLPINCIDWYTAFAFCVWDGGRLPTEAEWNYAAAGGSEQRIYPWSKDMNPPVLDDTYANYDCLGNGNGSDCVFMDIHPVGKLPLGDGRWGQADLAGNMAEWTLDWDSADYVIPCDNCAELTPGKFRVLRGGNWYNNESFLDTRFHFSSTPKLTEMGDFDPDTVGIRCAHDD